MREACSRNYGLATEVDRCVEDCAICGSYQNRQPAEPLKSTPTPDLPYMLVGCDLFDFQSKTYILTMDYYFKYIYVLPLTLTNTTAIVEALKSIFTTHGIPTILRSDNGRQFSSFEFKKFCIELEIDHQTSSPHFQSANGEAERSLQTVKNLWTTPFEGIDLSPSQLLIGRRPRNTLPASRKLLKPNMHNSINVKRHFDREKEKQNVFYYDKRRGVKELPSLNNNCAVRMTPLPGSKEWKPGTIVKRSDKPRSDIERRSDSENNRLCRRNHRHLRTSTTTASKDINRETSSDNFEFDNLPNRIESVPKEAKHDNRPDVNKERVEEVKSSDVTTTKSGRRVMKPKKLDLYIL
ncbi:unnamed protein product [Mytilus coruscus]|uniref:Integrase catalytic domain-containing protein n=1 Tax=Mytilus coruscus TaxID=42192 RepID=A0A6J8D6B8_MYTCO|nr:unnamed protein product [Mytilus coruscus]